ncbi:MAG: LTA synthase family protein [Gemmiger sp.]|uniref:LTA synthase family protein n=1 Tax=Gemmiger sp. TaxID=2049027 RepID=UPI002E788191|nr:LTA synthase family protein [Gemmiger sp.]MEE0799847.1 LTA synthase family protein [Gemmiger sp.]
MQTIKHTLLQRKFWLGTVVPLLLGLAAAFIARYQLELSDGVTPDYLAGQWPVYAPLNALTAFCITLVLFALIGRWSLATGLSGALFTVLALVNYYTRDLHGSALMPQDVLNLGTAAEVMGSYTLHITQTVVRIVVLYLPVLVIAALQRRLAGPRHRASWRQRGIRVAGCAVAVFAVLYFGYFGPNPIKPASTYGWAWQETYYKYGYLAGTIESAALMADPILMPENYTDESADAAVAMAADYEPSVETAAAQDYPDVVLILSESFYDFSLVTDLQADQDIFSVTKNLPNSIYGHTVSPHVGGGTNSSEYEMLSSNSLMLMPSITPFNWLNLHNANSLTGYLKDLGYATMAAHPYTNSNYRRDSAWLALGFDETHFQDDFPTRETYGNRPYQTDSATYRDLATLYEAMPEDQPRFTFLVSIQSHGDYDMNPPEADLVHAATDYGEYDDVMDEFLSNMYLTDQAFGELTDYFTKVYAEQGRRVIVAMAGDHAPSFVDHVADKTIAPANDLQILERSTPYIIWANYPLENAGTTNEADPYNRMDMCLLAPTLAEQAGLPLTPFYRYLLAMKQRVPVFTAGNDYMAADGTTHLYGEDAELDNWVHGYYALEYNNIGTGAKRNQALFETETE